ncbi:MAG: hypothetical protein GQ578_03060 [Desulfuromonadaceae bacterium]|nr:hypothetical protein [Desulfuromonadaceae bacterium]
MSRLSTLHKSLDLFRQIRYRSGHILLEALWTCLPTIAFSGIINIENTLQASLAVRCRDAQTGGFIFLRRGYAL